MNFTREPIIETIITPKEGYKLIVRNSKGSVQEEYSVDAVEVVSFGHSFFFRSSERPKSFLLPVGDYEVIQTKETRVVLKNAPVERSIKIGGGKPPRPQQEREKEEDLDKPAVHGEPVQHGPHDDKSKRRKGLRRRRGGDDRHEPREHNNQQRLEITPPTAPIEKESVGAELNLAKANNNASEEAPVVSSMFRSLFPPPPQLISDHIHRYKIQEPAQENVFSDDVKNKPKVEEKTKEESSESSHDEKPEHKQNDDHNDHHENHGSGGDSPRYHQAPRDEEERNDNDQPKTLDSGMDHNFML